MMKDSYFVEIYASGPCYCSACASLALSIKEVVRLVNAHNPTGIDSRWRLSEESFEGGEKNPHSCEKYRDRSHYLFVC